MCPTSQDQKFCSLPPISWAPMVAFAQLSLIWPAFLVKRRKHDGGFVLTSSFASSTSKKRRTFSKGGGGCTLHMCCRNREGGSQGKEGKACRVIATNLAVPGNSPTNRLMLHPAHSVRLNPILLLHLAPSLTAAVRKKTRARLKWRTPQHMNGWRGQQTP